MTAPFFKIPVGANFEFRGRRYRKLALSMACDEERMGNVFHDQTEVVLAEGPSLGPTGPTRATCPANPTTPKRPCHP